MDRPQFLRMFEARGGEQFGQRLQGGVMIIEDPFDLVGHHQRASAGWVLRGHPGRTPIGMARERLDAAKREHEAARRIAPVGADRHRARHVEGGGDLSGSANLDAVARFDADQRVMDEIDALAHRHAQMVHEFQRRSTGAALIAVDHDEVGINAGLQHRLADRQKFPGMADAQFETGGLAAG